MSSSSSAAPSPIASKSRETSGASGRPSSRMNIAASLFDPASASQVKLKDTYLGGLKEEQQGNLTHQQEENSEHSDNPAAGTWYYEGEPGAQNNEAWGNPLHTEPVLQLTRKVKRIRKNKFQKNQMILNQSPGITSLLLKVTKLVGNHLQEKQQNPSVQLFRKVKTIKKRRWNTSLPYRHKQPLVRKPTTTRSGRSTEDNQAIPWRIWM